MASNQYNRNINGIPNVVCGIPCEADEGREIIYPLKIQHWTKNDEGQDIIYTSTDKSVDYDTWEFSLPSIDGAYVIRQIGIKIFNLSTADEVDYYEELIPIIETIPSVLSWPADIREIDLVRTSLLLNGAEKLKLIVGHYYKQGVLTIAVHAKRKPFGDGDQPSNVWWAEEYKLTGYYLLERQ